MTGSLRSPLETERPARDLLVTARALATDAVCAEVVTALRDREVDAILLKGPTTAEWLYPHTARGYCDADLLVAPDKSREAAAVLDQLGFEPVRQFVSPHAHPWIRDSDGAEVDLHTTIWGPHRPAAALWRELQQHVDTTQIGTTRVRVLTRAGRALHVALHAAQHRDNSAKAREDLRRAAHYASIETWRQAERLADRLWAIGEMADGLALEPEGRVLLEHLPIARAAALVNQGGPRLAVARARVREARGAHRKALVILRLLIRRVRRKQPQLSRPAGFRRCAQRSRPGSTPCPPRPRCR